MTDEHERIVSEIEQQLIAIDAQIADLEAQRETILLHCTEYADYVEAYCTAYDDQPLCLRQYFELTEELDRISDEMMLANPGEFDNIWKQNEARLQYLERVLVA